MRETCARLLAAALLTGVIATVVGMSALVDAPQEPTRSVAAPASSVERTVRLKVHAVPRRRRSARPVVTTHISYRAPRPAVATRRLIVVRTHPAPSQPRQRRLASVAAPVPPAAAAPAPAAPPATVEAPPPADPATQVPDTSPGPGRHGRGHAYGHEKQDD